MANYSMASMVALFLGMLASQSQLIATFAAVNIPPPAAPSPPLTPEEADTCRKFLEDKFKCVEGSEMSGYLSKDCCAKILAEDADFNRCKVVLPEELLLIFPAIRKEIAGKCKNATRAAAPGAGTTPRKVLLPAS